MNSIKLFCSFRNLHILEKYLRNLFKEFSPIGFLFLRKKAFSSSAGGGHPHSPIGLWDDEVLDRYLSESNVSFTFVEYLIGSHLYQ